MDQIGLKSPEAGDLFVLLKPGYVFENNGINLFNKPTFKGDHGYSLKHEDSYGFLIANETCDPCSTIDVAGFIENSLDLN